MAAESYPRALSRVLVYEGGKVDDFRDPGGRTNQGVIQRVYTAYRRNKGLSPRDVYQMDSAERDEIYRLQYWDKIKGDNLPAGVDFVVFDGAVNSGPVQATKWLQRALGVSVDGMLGEATLLAAREHPDHDRLIADILERRLAFLKALRTWKTFGKGWTARLNSVRAGGQAIAMGSVGPSPVFASGMNRKALIDDAKKGPSKAVADATAGGGFATGAISQTTEALSPVADYSSYLSTVLAVLTVIGALMVVAGLVYRSWAKRKEAELADALDRKPRSFDADNDDQPLAEAA
jgi:lysozyme family protein